MNKMNKLSMLLCIEALFAFVLIAGCEEQYAQRQNNFNDDWANRPLWSINSESQVINNDSPTNKYYVTAETKPTVAKAAPKLTFTETSHNFGNIEPNSKNLYQFSFRNTGNAVLRIEEINNECGCTVSIPDKREYAPGETGVLAVGYLADTQVGDSTKMINVISNDPENPEISLSIKSRINSSVDIQPKVLSLSIMDKNGNCPDIVVTSLDGQPFSITNFQSSSNCITANYDPSVKATKFVLKPQVNMNLLSNMVNGRFEIGLSHPQTKQISGTFNAPTRFASSPSAISVYQAKAGTTINKKLSVVSNYNENFTIESITSRSGIVKAANQKQVKNGYEFDVEVTPPTNSTSRVLTDILTIRFSSGMTYDVPCNITYQTEQLTSSSSTNSNEECPTCTPLIIDSTGSSRTPSQQLH